MQDIADLMDLLRVTMRTDFATIAQQAGVRPRFVYDLRDGNARQANCDGRRVPATEDERYIKMARLFELHGIDGFMKAATDAQSSVTPMPIEEEDALSIWLTAAIDHLRSTDNNFRRLFLRALGVGFGVNAATAFGGKKPDITTPPKRVPEDPPGTDQLYSLLLDSCPSSVSGPLRQQTCLAVLDAYALLFEESNAG